MLKCHQGVTTSSGTDRFPTNVHVSCRLRLEVEATDEPAFEAKFHGQFKPATIPAVGDEIEVLYDPADHDKVVVPEAARSEGRVDVQIVRSEDGDPDRPVPTITINGQTVTPGSAVEMPSGGGPDPAKELAELAKLRDQGVLTDTEFEAQKTKLLDRL